MCIKYKSSFWMKNHGTLWIMLEDALVEYKVFRTNFTHLVYTSVGPQPEKVCHILFRNVLFFLKKKQ